MARKKGNQQKKGVSNTGSGSPVCLGKTGETIGREDEDTLNMDASVPLNESTSNKLKGEAPMKRKNKSKKSPTGVQEVGDRAHDGEPKETGSGCYDTERSEGLHSAERDDMPQHACGNSKSSGSTFSPLLNGLHSREEVMKHVEVSYALVARRLKSFCSSALMASEEWMERQKPLFISARTYVADAFNYAKRKMEVAYPVVLKLSMHVLNVLLLILMLWLDCTLRGIDSFLRMGTTTFFSVLWCSVLCIIAVTGVFKFLLALVAILLVGLFVGFTIAFLLMAISAIVLLWCYGSFWTTMLFVMFGGLTFAVGRGRLAMFIATSYSVYCAWASVGSLGLLFGLNLSFISSDVLIFILKNTVHERRSNTEQAAEGPGQPDFFFDGQIPTSATNRGPGIPSTSGSDHETTSEDEVIRLLNCSDNYAALGLSRFEDIDVTVLKREYKKKAMLVHPDKNMGNEKAVEAFKKLQNAYEVLLDSSKRKAYDDELKREELLNYFRQFKENPQRSKRRNGLFSPGHAHDEGEDPFREMRRIACRKCGDLHVWIHTNKVKSRARWCQECGDFHPAKDGDGWVEQSSHPIIFGMLQKVDPPAAFVCADGKIYDATEWYICQGMRCPANSHKPGFHVNTSITTPKPSQRGGIPNVTPNMEESMTKEELFEWFQNAVQSGMFDKFQGGGPENSPSAGSTSKGGTSGGGSGSGSGKRKKKGKK